MKSRRRLSSKKGRVLQWLERSENGSISVFLAYLLVFVLATVFALLEVSRVWGLEQRTQTDVVMTTNSLLADYATDLWEEYGLLFLDGSNGQGEFSLSDVEKRGMTYSTENLDVRGGESGEIQSQTWNLYGMQPMLITVTAYGLATDQNGRAFRTEAAKVMESQVTEVMLQEAYDLLTNEEESHLSEIDVQETSQEIVLAENPIDVAEQMKQKGILGWVTEEEALSNKNMDLSESLSARSLRVGTYMVQEVGGDWREKLLFRLYLENYFPCYLESKEEHVLDYELEYLVVGKSSDKENLLGVVNRLLAVREVANLQFLKTNAAKQEMVLAAATALATATLSPELIPVYKTGIMAAWAYAESVSDVRLLLQGQNVSMVKTESQWHTDLTGLKPSAVEIEQEQGLSYQEYLRIFLWSTKDSVLSYRAMDLIEHNTGRNMNYQIYCLEGTVGYQGNPLFASLLSIGKNHLNTYQFQQDFFISYLTD